MVDFIDESTTGGWGDMSSQGMYKIISCFGSKSSNPSHVPLPLPDNLCESVSISIHIPLPLHGNLCLSFSNPILILPLPGNLCLSVSNSSPPAS